MKTDVAYIHSKRLIQLCDLVPANRKRAGLVHSLIAAYGLLGSLLVVAPQPATQADLQEFHDEDYLECLATIEEDGESGGDGGTDVEGDDVCFTDPQTLEKCREFGFVSSVHHSSSGAEFMRGNDQIFLLSGCRTTAQCFVGYMSTLLWSLGRR